MSMLCIILTVLAPDLFWVHLQKPIWSKVIYLLPITICKWPLPQFFLSPPYCAYCINHQSFKILPKKVLLMKKVLNFRRVLEVLADPTLLSHYSFPFSLFCSSHTISKSFSFLAMTVLSLMLFPRLEISFPWSLFLSTLTSTSVKFKVENLWILSNLSN